MKIFDKKKGGDADSPKPEKTPEELAAIAFLDELRECRGEKKPERLPLACIVKVLEYTEIPKANEAYALVRVQGPDERTWRLSVFRGVVKVGQNALFVSDEAALPDRECFRNEKVCTVKEKVYKFGFGAKARRLLPHVKRNVYRNNCGVLYPMSSFGELKGRRVGQIVAVQLGIENSEELKMRQQMPAGTKVFRPASMPRPRTTLLGLLKKLRG